MIEYVVIAGMAVCIVGMFLWMTHQCNKQREFIEALKLDLDTAQSCYNERDGEVAELKAEVASLDYQRDERVIVLEQRVAQLQEELRLTSEQRDEYKSQCEIKCRQNAEWKERFHQVTRQVKNVLDSFESFRSFR